MFLNCIIRILFRMYLYSSKFNKLATVQICNYIENIADEFNAE